MSEIRKNNIKFKQEIYKRRKITLFKKIYELKKFCDVKIVIIIYKRD